MAEKEQRRAAVRSILGESRGKTQEEIRLHLKARGIIASQATLSRDLREMGAVKIPEGGGGACYVLGEDDRSIPSRGDIGQAMRVFSGVCEQVGNFLVVRTTPGNAVALCVVLDRQGFEEIAGTIAGDDTILVIARSEADGSKVLKKLTTSHDEGIE
jgi:transcriptional regulator of arginine metabolism